MMREEGIAICVLDYASSCLHCHTLSGRTHTAQRPRPYNYLATSTRNLGSGSERSRSILPPTPLCSKFPKHASVPLRRPATVRLAVPTLPGRGE